MLNPIAGYDELDSSTVNVPVVDYVRAIRTPASKLRLGVPKAGFYENPHPETAQAMEAARAYEQATEWHKRRPRLTS